MISKVKIVAHRGYSEEYPENTILAFEKAIELGSDSIEFDVHFTKDSKLVVHHDYYLGSTDNGKGAIYSRSSDYIRTLDAGFWKAKRFLGEKIPFLSEVFEKLGGKIKFEVELKGISRDFVDAVILEVKKFNLFSDIEFISWHIPLLTYLKQKVPKAKIGFLTTPFPKWMDKKLSQEIVFGGVITGNFDVAHCQLSILDLTFVGRLKNAGILVHAGDCNRRVEIMKALRLGVNQISTDKLKLALTCRKSYEQF